MVNALVQAIGPLQADVLLDSIYLLLFLAGIGLMAAEAMAPGTHVFVLGIGFLTAGVVGMLLPMATLGILGPLIVIAAVFVVTALTFWGYQKTALAGGEGRGSTTDSDSLRGQFGTVTETVTRTGGEVKLEDGGFNPNFQARATDGTIEEGAEVMVVDPGGGNVLTVEAVGAKDDIDRELEREREATEGDAEPGSDAVDDAERDVESENA